MRVARERDERGIMQLLDRCERILELDPDFESVPWRARSPSLPRKRWKEGGRGWSGLDPDDLVSRIARRTDAERSEDRAKAKAVLKKAFSRAANREMGKTRRQSSVFSRTATPDSKTVA